MSVSLSGTVSESVPYHAAVKSVKTSILPYGRLAYLYKLTDFFPLCKIILKRHADAASERISKTAQQGIVQSLRSRDISKIQAESCKPYPYASRNE